jgi:MYXO-CTERM domain-containing protein
MTRNSLFVAFMALTGSVSVSSAQILDLLNSNPLPGSPNSRYQGGVYTGGGTDAVLWNNGPVSDGVNGANPISQLIAPNSTFGAGAQTTATNAVAEDFVVGAGGWNVNQLTFFMYQTGATAFSFTGLNYQITTNNADPIAWTAGAANNGGFAAYRVLSTTPADTNRPIFAIQVPVNISLSPGNYFLRWQASGSLASGPWQPPVAPFVAGNATQSITAGAFLPLIDAGSTLNMELPFKIDGTVAPAPGSLGLLGLGGLIAARRRRS